MKPITLPTTPAQREAFAQLGLTLWADAPGIEERWDFDDTPALILMNGAQPSFYQTLRPAVSAQVLQILDMLPPPPGMVLVPRDVLERGLQSLRVINTTPWTSAGLLMFTDKLKTIIEASTSTTSPEPGKEEANGRK